MHKHDRLLLVDDDEMFRLSTTALLHISDINMPGNRQFEFITEVIQS